MWVIITLYWEDSYSTPLIYHKVLRVVNKNFNKFILFLFKRSKSLDNSYYTHFQVVCKNFLKKFVIYFFKVLSLREVISYGSYYTLLKLRVKNKFNEFYLFFLISFFLCTSLVRLQYYHRHNYNAIVNLKFYRVRLYHNSKNTDKKGKNGIKFFKNICKKSWIHYKNWVLI